MSTDAYLSFLAAGVVLVLIDGQIIHHSGRRFLADAYGDSTAAASVTRLVTVLFHLTTLGVLALVSTIDFGGSDLPGVVGRLGVMLLILALAHAITLAGLSHIRGEKEAETLMEHGIRARRPDPAAQQPTVTTAPVADNAVPRRASI
ncbi:MAG TPA: hypothetical protein VG674_27730 [Amycolatopsis sp.]|nr:hypothetical protein [Amycolatopsis sp.]